MRASDIMSQARDRLGDIKKQRWSDSRLLNIVSQGQTDICLETGFLRKSTLISLVNDTTIYTLPNDCFTIKRIEYNDELLPLQMRSDKDIPRATLSEYTAYKSNLKTKELEIQPAPTEIVPVAIFIEGNRGQDAYQVTPLYGVITEASDSALIYPEYGAVTGVDTSAIGNAENDGYGELAGFADVYRRPTFPNDNYGVVISVELTEDKDQLGFISSVRNNIVIGEFGVSANVSRLSDTFKVFYVAYPRKLDAVESTLVLPDLWEDLLLKYVVGTALQDDNDANNIQRGEYELNKYAAKLATLNDLDSKDYSASSSDKNITNFRRV